MSSSRQALLIAMLACLGVVVSPQPATGQSEQAPSEWAIDAWAGFTVPTTDVGVMQNVGPNVGVGVLRRLTPRLTLRVEGAADFLPGGGFTRVDRFLEAGAPEEGPDLEYYHATAGLGLDLARPSEEHPWRITAKVAGGATTLDVEDSPFGEARTHTNPTLHGGLVLGRRVSEDVELIARGQGYVILGDADDPNDYLGQELVLPFSLGLRLTP